MHDWSRDETDNVCLILLIRYFLCNGLEDFNPNSCADIDAIGNEDLLKSSSHFFLFSFLSEGLPEEKEYLYTSQLPKSSCSGTNVRVNLIFGRLDAVDERVCEKSDESKCGK